MDGFLLTIIALVLILILMVLCADWVLKTDQSVVGDSLSYLDMMERNTVEETRCCNKPSWLLIK